MEDQIGRDLKQAMLAGDKAKVSMLRVIKSALQYEVLALGQQDKGLSDEQFQKVLSREAKKRQEAAELYTKAGETERADKELQEKALIDSYLPESLSDSEVEAIVKQELAKLSDPSPSDLGKVIGAVRARTQGRADGAMIANLVRSALETK